MYTFLFVTMDILYCCYRQQRMLIATSVVTLSCCYGDVAYLYEETQRVVAKCSLLSTTLK